ncbi:hypothetical protein WJX84_011109 [Apatococcus fuscideae]|uniref:Uncharacterized protein n=1 Tax=Apatococcus fuscideae TaxID=2026836 RepID=A0AAW1SWA3_9CHLO
MASFLAGPNPRVTQCSTEIGRSCLASAPHSSRNKRHGGHLSAGSYSASGSCSPRCSALYAEALKYARSQTFERARDAFADCVASCPSLVKAYISWAQMEKRSRTAGEQDDAHLHRARVVLQRGLTRNPYSASLCQAWGLMELQKGNFLAAILLLERSVLYDPSFSPVLRWRQVIEARGTISSRRHAAVTVQSNQQLFQ